MSELSSLRELPLFASVDEQTLRRLALDAKIEAFGDGGVIFRQGDAATSIFIVLHGFVKLMRIAPNGDETLINICSGGESVCEALAPEGGFYRVSAEAVGPVSALRLSAARFARVLSESPALAAAVIDEATSKISVLIGEIESLKGQNADQRLARFILSLCPHGKESCSFRLPYDKRLIAARLGVKQETLSRAFAKLRELGVRTETREVYVDSVTRLSAECDDLGKHARLPSERRQQARENRGAIQ